MNSFGSSPDRKFNDLIDGFISTEVVERGLDERTQKAYRLDLEHFSKWLEKEEVTVLPEDRQVYQKRVEQYFRWLVQEKRLRSSTISRKYRVFRYFMTYLVREGFCSENLKAMKEGITQIYAADFVNQKRPKEAGSLSRNEVDRFFQAIRREAKEADSDFRRRLCLRDHVMMGLLFYHGIEVTELLKIELSDYCLKSGILIIRRKREKEHSVCLFSRELKELMEKWLDEHEYFEHHEEFRERMFLSKMGRPLSMKMVILIFEKYRVLAGIEKKFTPKDLKNSLERYGIELIKERG